MRVLLVRPGPFFSVQDVSRGWVNGLRQCGVDVLDFNFDDRLNFYGSAHVPNNGELVQAFQPPEAAALAAKGIEVAAFEWQPDVVMVVSGFFVPPATYEILRARGIRVVLVHTESPYEDDRQVQRAQFVDLNVVNDPTNLGRFPKGSVYLPHAFDPDLHFPRPSRAGCESDFCFVGTGYPSRIEFFEKVDWSGLSVFLAGHWAGLEPESQLVSFMAHELDVCCPNEETVDLYASTKVSANLYRKEATESAEGWSMGPREVELAACGVFFLRESRPEGDELFRMLPTFESPEDFGDQLRWWLAHDDARVEAARLARVAVSDRTFRNNAARLLSLLDT